MGFNFNLIEIGDGSVEEFQVFNQKPKEPFKAQAVAPVAAPVEQRKTLQDLLPAEEIVNRIVQNLKEKLRIHMEETMNLPKPGAAGNAISIIKT